METDNAVAGLSALAHPGRLAVFRLLIKAGPAGLPAGEIARAVGSLPNTLSSNLGILDGAGLIHARREGRSIIYTAAYDRMRDLLAFLIDDCCGGDLSICAPLTEVMSRAACCAAPTTEFA
jgi:ArsR family transcriptional regulator